MEGVGREGGRGRGKWEVNSLTEKFYYMDNESEISTSHPSHMHTCLHSILPYMSALHSPLHVCTPFFPTCLHSILPYTSLPLSAYSQPVGYHKVIKEDELSDSEEEEEVYMKEGLKGGEKNLRLKMGTEKKLRGPFVVEKVLPRIVSLALRLEPPNTQWSEHYWQLKLETLGEIHHLSLSPLFLRSSNMHLTSLPVSYQCRMEAGN